MGMTLNHDHLKAQNRGLVFQLLATGDETSRVTLSQKSGLSKMTLSNIINEFLDKGYVTETGGGSGRGSRNNPIRVSLAPSAPKVLGILIRRGVCQAVVCDFSLNILDSREFALPDEFDNQLLLGGLFSMADALLQTHADIMGIGVGSIGPVDIRNGILLEPLKFSDVRNLHVKSLFEQRYHLPVYLEHHYNCAALAETYFGNGKGCQNLFYVGMPNGDAHGASSGVGLGVICGGRLYSDFTGYSCEIGHVAINNFDGPLCSCGNRGCLGAYMHISSILDDAKTWTGASPANFREVCCQSDVPGIDQILMSQMIRPLIFALSSAINLLNPDLVLLGDIVAELPDRYLGYMEQRLNERIFARYSRRVRVRRAHFPSRYNADMCAITVIDQVFRGQHLF